MCWGLDLVYPVSIVVGVVRLDTISEGFCREIEGVVGVACYGSITFSDLCETILVVVGVGEGVERKPPKPRGSEESEK